MALVEGTKYGLSSYHNQTHSSPQTSNKSVVFVKLTDSALKAIEEFLKLQHKTGQNATLQFLGNEGRINIPSSQGSQGQTFDFSLSPNTDIEGPQGSFECIKQCGQRSMESMGTLPFKMRVKANDDVYAEAEKRFSAIEEGRKQQCAKEIKPNGADIGRKVKKKGMDRIPPPMKRRDPSPFSNHLPKSSPNNSLGNKSSSNAYSHSPAISKNLSSLNGLGNANFNNGGPKVPNGGSSTGTLNVTKRPLKERLIHLLALKPYKKPELIARLSRDGIKDREKTLVMTIIKQISTFKDNEYNILRGIWNDVQEDWPYYSEQERQLMKRRKPQNLTPPGSDCSASSGVSGCSLSPRSIASTGFGHSPPSHHSNNFSSSQMGTKSMSSNRGSMSNQCNPLSQGVKRPATDPLVGPDGKLLEDISAYSDVPNKKLRVSNFKRPVCSNSGSSTGIQAPTNSTHNGFGANLNPNARSDKDGLSPHFHQNRIADRLSPIGGIGTAFSNGGGHGSGLAHAMTNHRSPLNGIGDQVASPPYYNNTINNQLSPQGTLQAGEEHMGEYSPYSWNSKNLNGGGVNPHDSQGYLDTNKSRGMDSDETDSIDSGNGSSGSSSGRHCSNNDDAGYNGVNNNHKGPSVNSKSLTNRGTELSGSQSANFVTSANCSRVSSTTTGSGSGYHTTPQSSPESHLESLQILQQQKGGCDGKVKQANGAASAGGRNGSTNSVVANGHSRTISKDREREKEPRGDRERTGRERESRGRDRERSDKRGHRERKSAHGPVPMEIVRDGHNNNEDGDNTESTKPKPAPQYPPYLTKYASIESEEQRSRYKDDFNTEYPLYRDLHAVIEKVSKKFAQLEERLRSEKRGSEEYQMVRDQIVKEYYSSKKDKKYQEAKENFNYLHKKLSHIKALVGDYDRHSTSGTIASPVR